MGWIVISAIVMSATFIFTSCLLTRHNYSNVFSTKTNIANRWVSPRLLYLQCKRTGDTVVLNQSKRSLGLPTISSCDIDITHMVQLPQVDPPSWPGHLPCFCAMIVVWGLVPVDRKVRCMSMAYTWLPCGLLEGHVLCKMYFSSDRANAVSGSGTVQLGRLCLCIWRADMHHFKWKRPRKKNYGLPAWFTWLWPNDHTNLHQAWPKLLLIKASLLNFKPIWLVIQFRW